MYTCATFGYECKLCVYLLRLNTNVAFGHEFKLYVYLFRLDTDIAFGYECKFKSLAVLTGVCSLEELHTKASSNLPEDIRLVPDFYVQSLGDLSHMIEDH